VHLLLGLLFSLSQVLSYPFPNALAGSNDGKSIAYVLNERGVHSLWFAQAPAFTPHMLWTSGSDDGQEISDLSISNDGKYVVFVRGGNHDANWPERPRPNPDLRIHTEPHMQVMAIATSGGEAKVLADGDAPAISPDNTRVAFIHDPDNKVWIAPLDGSKAAAQYFFDRGDDGDLTWAPDGHALAFTSDRGDHSFIGVYSGEREPLVFLNPSTNRDFSPKWSPDSTRVAFVRIGGSGGPPQDPLRDYPTPWQIMAGSASSGAAHEVWGSGKALRDSLPEINGPQLRWVAGNQLSFISERDNRPHLYVVSSAGGAARELMHGNFMVEDTALSPDMKTLYYTADTGNLPGDDDRRHIFRVSVNGGAPVQVTHGTSSEWWPAATANGVAYVQAGARKPMTIVENGKTLDEDQIPKDFPTNSMVVPKEVTFRSKDGLLIHGQLFTPTSGGTHPGLIYVHGGPPRQMLLSWHYFDYYSYDYATNQYLANHGFTVLSVNYRLGIGYGHDFHHPPHAGPAGAAEYQDVVAGARYLQHVAHVDPKRIGIWGGSYGGYLTAMGLSKNSDIFKAGYDRHGVHDWTMFPEWFGGAAIQRYQQPDMKRFLRTAWLSSPDAYVADWRSPVILIQGDDDRNVHFHQMVDLVERLKHTHVHYEQLVIPNETHGFERWHSWLQANQAGADFLTRELRP
jgi:dipeptidyl aminopeptidase/acylaminoacyl peptidase